MAFDMSSIKGKVDEIVAKLKSDPKAMDKFKSNPEKTVEEIAGVDIPDGAMDKVVDAVKGALASDKLAGAGDKLKGLFGKK